VKKKVYVLRVYKAVRLARPLNAALSIVPIELDVRYLQQNQRSKNQMMEQQRETLRNAQSKGTHRTKVRTEQRNAQNAEFAKATEGIVGQRSQLVARQVSKKEKEDEEEG
jgi:hypothetical protein